MDSDIREPEFNDLFTLLRDNPTIRVIAMRFIRNADKQKYRKVVAALMIAVSLWLIVSQFIQ